MRCRGEAGTRVRPGEEPTLTTCFGSLPVNESLVDWPPNYNAAALLHAMTALLRKQFLWHEFFSNRLGSLRKFERDRCSLLVRNVRDDRIRLVRRNYVARRRGHGNAVVAAK